MWPLKLLKIRIKKRLKRLRDVHKRWMWPNIWWSAGLSMREMRERRREIEGCRVSRLRRVRWVYKL